MQEAPGENKRKSTHVNSSIIGNYAIHHHRQQEHQNHQYRQQNARRLEQHNQCIVATIFTTQTLVTKYMELHTHKAVTKYMHNHCACLCVYVLYASTYIYV